MWRSVVRFPEGASPVPIPQYLTLADAAERHGVSVRTLRRRVAEGALPAYRIGPRAIRVKADDLAELARRIPTAASA